MNIYRLYSKLSLTNIFLYIALNHKAIKNDLSKELIHNIYVKSLKQMMINESNKSDINNLFFGIKQVYYIK